MAHTTKSGLAGTVPSVTGFALAPGHTYSSIWVGIDGDGFTDLVQCGTGQEVVSFFTGWTTATYYAWTEFLPQQPTSQQIVDFPINPGDKVFFNLVVGDSGVTPNLSGQGMLAFVRNDTTHQFTSVTTARGSTTVIGSDVVWIVERPSVSGVIQPLSRFDSVTISTPTARRVDGGLRGYQGGAADPSVQIAMRNDANTADICTVVAVDAQNMTFTWLGFN